MQVTYKSALNPVNIENANERQQKLFEQAKSIYKFIPNMQKSMANYPPLLESYLNGVSAFRMESGFSIIEQEIVFISISFENNCDYCVASHSLIAEIKAKMSKDLIHKLRNDEKLSDLKLNTLKEFSKHILTEKGYPKIDEVKRFIEVGYSETQVLAIIHAISLKTLSNYVNHIFHTELDTISKVWEWDSKSR